MEFNNDKINNLLNDWIRFRDESFCSLTKEDTDFDKYSGSILRNVSPTNKSYVQNQLDKLDENYLDYIGYWNDKYYKNGFKDAVNLILYGLAGG